MHRRRNLGFTSNPLSRIPKILFPATGAAFGLLSVLCLFIGLKQWPARPDLTAFAIFFGIAAAALLFARKRRPQVALALASALIAIYSAESIFGVIDRSQTQAAAAERAGVEFDPRNRLEVVDQLRAEGKNAFPTFSVNMERRKLGPQSVIPLAGISNATMVMPRESGSYPIYLSDEFGFNNPVGWSERTNLRTIALVGDSFVEGIAVEPDETMRARLAARLDPAEWQVVATGFGGAAPLTELGVLIEYLRPIEPEIVFWCYFENDLSALLTEAETALIRYLREPGFSQNLSQRQPEIDAFWAPHVDRNSERFRKRLAAQPEPDPAWLTWLKMSRIRKRLVSSAAEPVPHRNLRENALPLFSETLKRAEDEVRSWNGQLIFVHLPSYHRYTAAGAKSETISLDPEVLAIARAQGLEVIDLHEEVFVQSGDPKSLFPFRRFGHYNAKGYKLAAERMFERIPLDESAEETN